MLVERCESLQLERKRKCSPVAIQAHAQHLELAGAERRRSAGIAQSCFGSLLDVAFVLPRGEPARAGRASGELPIRPGPVDVFPPWVGIIASETRNELDLL